MVLDVRALTRVLSSAVRIQLDGYDVGEVLDQLCTDTCEILGLDGAAVSLVGTEGIIRCVTATGEAVARCEQWQETHQKGPSHDAFHHGDEVVVEDLEQSSEDRWGDFAAVVARSRIRLVAAFPMQSSSRRLGALTLYHRAAEPVSSEERGAGRLMAELASLYIANHRKLMEHRNVADELQHALDSRVVIEQAKGIIAARQGVDMPKAFGMLRRQSRNTNTEIHKVAYAIVSGELTI